MRNFVRTTRQFLSDNVAWRWSQQYPEEHWTDKQDILKKLQSFPKGTNPNVVDKIIGNDSWTRQTCDQCEKSVVAVTRVGQMPDYESNTASLCDSCVEKLYKFMLKEKKKK